MAFVAPRTALLGLLSSPSGEIIGLNRLPYVKLLEHQHWTRFTRSTLLLGLLLPPRSDLPHHQH
jgi:hypothetical protein